MTDGVAYYRLPGQSQYFRISGPVRNVTDYNQLSSGFIIAPFCESADCPVLFIDAEKSQTFQTPQRATDQSDNLPNPDDLSPEYQEDFQKFHGAVADGRFHKLVLSRSRKVNLTGTADPEAMFQNACREYPDFMVMMFSTPHSGTWLSATPEPLLELDGTIYHSVALAGTMPKACAEKGWSNKNKLEQHIVQDFITDAISGKAQNINIQGPFSSPAGELMHLKTDISFTASKDVFWELAQRLHPTPASCGLPQAEAREFIQNNESHNRRYYSGFAGPVNIQNQNRLYVLLRCMELDSDLKSLTLYAGGGILPESICGSEYDETVQKMKTIAKCIATKKI